jgi:hypothetical protein
MSESSHHLNEFEEISVAEMKPGAAYIEVPEDEKVSPPNLNRFGLQDEHNQVWRMNVPHKTVPEQCLEQEFWQHVSSYLRPGDEIVVMADDMAWKMRLHVINAAHNWAQVSQDSFHSYATRDQMESVPSIYAVRYAGTTHKWQVLRKGELLKEGLATEALARRAVSMHEDAVKR